MIRYVFKEGPVAIRGAKDANPQVIGEALSALAEAGGGALTPRAVVDGARAPASPLHAHFDWNDAEAAEKWRVEQARDLIRCIRVEETDSNHEPVRAFLSVSGDAGVSYHTVQEIRSSGELRERLLAAAERDLEAFTTRYRVLKDICAVVETAKKVARAKRRADETQVAA